MIVGWIGLGRMGLPMAERMIAAGYSLKVWNRTRAKAEPLLAKGAAIADRLRDLRDVDILFTMVSTGTDLEEVLFGREGVIGEGKAALPKIVVDCSSIGVEESAEIRDPPRRLRHPLRGRAGQRQRQMRQGRQAVERRLGAEGRLRDGEAADRDICRRAASPMSARASSPASARSPTTSCSAW